MNNFPQRDYADVSERSELVRQTSLAVANAQSPPGECFVFGTGDNGQLGMGDDLSLPERESCRTPMQWSDEPQGGFTKSARPTAPPIGTGV